MSSRIASALLLCACPIALAAAAPAMHGIDPANMDTTVKPGDDFDRYANGGWVAHHDIPADQSSWGIFEVLREQSDQRTANLIRELGAAKSSLSEEARKIGDFYASFMDEAAIERLGLAPLKSPLADIAAIADKHALAHALGETIRADVDALDNTNFYTENVLGLWTAPGFTDSRHYTAYLLQGGLGMPDREYYLAQNAKMAQNRAAYGAHIAALLRLAGFTDTQAKAQRILALETRIAKAHASRADSADVLKANNPWPRTQFDQRAPGLDWRQFFDGAGLSGQTMLMVWHPGAVRGLAASVKEVPLDVWKDYLAFHLLDQYGSVLPKAFVAENFSFYGRQLAGTPQLRERWKRGVNAVNAALGEAVGKLYAERYFSPRDKAVADAMVRQTVAAFGRRIDGLAWMSQQTRRQAHEKLATLYVGIGYPEHWRDYSALRIVRGDAWGNRQRADLYEYQRQLTRLGKEVDRKEWAMTPQMVNAVNLPLRNALNFPAAILQPPFFDAQADAAFNYGAMGAVIGHEISHSFDDQGSQFDGQGRLHDWWTAEDLKHFKASAARLVAQYDAYRPFPELHVNGQATLSENIADIAGLSAAYDGWRASLAGKEPPQAHGFTGEQQFFIAYAQIRARKVREPALREQIVTDGHAPSVYRTFAVRNLDEWYRAFNVGPGAKLYLPPAERVRIW